MQILGVVTDGEQLVISEFMTNSAMLNYLCKQKEKQDVPRYQLLEMMMIDVRANLSDLLTGHHYRQMPWLPNWAKLLAKRPGVEAQLRDAQIALETLLSNVQDETQSSDKDYFEDAR